MGEAYISLAIHAVEELKGYFEDPNKVRVSQGPAALCIDFPILLVFLNRGRRGTELLADAWVTL